MDFHGAALSYSGIEVLRMVETEGEKYVKGTTLPCSVDMGRWARDIEAFGDTKMPFKVGHIPDVGEFIAFEPADVIRLVIEVTGLTEDSKVRFVQLSDSIDGALITNNIGHVCYGVKVIDRKCVDPTTKQKTAALQSRNNVFPIVILIVKIIPKTSSNSFLHTFLLFRRHVMRCFLRHMASTLNLPITMICQSYLEIYGERGCSETARTPMSLLPYNK